MSLFIEVMIQVISSFGAAMFFGIIVNVPRRALWRCGVTGMVGWIVNWIMLKFGIGSILSIFCGAIVVSFFSIVYAKRMRVPATTFNIPGVFPMVPGIAAYQAVNAFVSVDYMNGMGLLMKTATISITIALAIVMVEIFYRLFMRLRNN